MYNQLTRGQRYAIYLGLQEGKSRKAIARQINVHPPAVGREIKRNPTRSGHYGRRVAQESADIRKERLPGNRRIGGKVLKEAMRLLFPYRKNVPAITTDNGSGFACHKKIARRLGTTVYFADSYASWQKGAVENANKLIRQYMPKGIDFREISDEFIRQIQYKINRRPHEKIKLFISKKEVLQFNCLKLHLLVDSAPPNKKGKSLGGIKIIITFAVH